ncbi:MAG: hypothetical protein FWH41_00975, partial [Treponema sp.]|nr:hypothetical protein [Treponema sp.]
MKKQFKAAFYKKVLLGLLAITFFLNGCTTTSNRPSSIVNPDVNYTLPRAGSANNAALAVKDYLTLGIFWVSSTETIDGDGNRTGSQITYEMLMREAQKLDADDIINIRIDVKQIHEFVRSSDFSSIISKTTYIYTANALAIKYTAATGGGATQSKSLEAVETLPQQQRMPASSTSRSARSSTVTEASTPSLDTASSTASSGASTPYRDTERSPAVAEPSTPSRNNAAASSSSSAVIA